ncbi:glycosyltransferase [Phycisphaera mikurensis]|uniref:Putative glycosyltransferase n=1 Tax=Phycisphaera mikurensis (strain NBRC 102666 / KCTC 22515 / FYK2301M01) TaxID=1142394 RepID=I0IBF6_PHYMF|nr:glycosyltransferase [Phycisphaera mikurensis]MBB6442873.1 glycosyltransferase involved in cell wall biosynthesis [Phycisphaera mikurensis]BAM02594.1 putative glycosyltransferase [Phycisphaera mikurensis NBRC 102666]
MNGSRPPRVLLISHAADRTGAPRSLLELLGFFCVHTAWDLRVLLIETGPLAPAFAALAPTELLHPPRTAGGKARSAARSAAWAAGSGHPRRAWKLATGGLGVPLTPGEQADRSAHARAAAARARAWAPDLLYANTAATWPAVRRLLPPQAAGRLLVHVRELASTLDRLGGAAELLARADRVLAVSPPVRALLAGAWGVPAAKLGEGPVALHDEAFAAAEPDAAAWPAGVGPRVLMLGSATRRKGADLFAAAAAAPGWPAGTRFLWVGDGPEAASLRRAGGRIRWEAARADPRPLLAAADLLLLSSRDDPSPRVVPEAAARGVPAACFAASGGAAGFVAPPGEPPAGVAVPAGFDPAELAAAAGGLLGDPPALAAAGVAARSRADSVRLGVVGPRIVAEVEALLPPVRGRVGGARS